MKHCPVGVYLLCLLHLVLGISSFAGGASLMLEPDGSLLGMKPGWLIHTPFAIKWNFPPIDNFWSHFKTRLENL